MGLTECGMKMPTIEGQSSFNPFPSHIKEIDVITLPVSGENEKVSWAYEKFSLTDDGRH